MLLWYASTGEHMTAERWQTDGERALQVVIAARGGELAGLFVLNGTQAPVSAVLPLLLSLIHISEPTRRLRGSRMPSSA